MALKMIGGRRVSMSRQLVALLIAVGCLIVVYRMSSSRALLADQGKPPVADKTPAPSNAPKTHWKDYLSQIRVAELKTASLTPSPTPCPKASTSGHRFSADAPKDPLPETRLIKHAPGWTIFENLYMAGGTLFIVTDERAKWPPTRMMTSSGDEAQNTPDNIALREPKDKHMTFIYPDAARKRWGNRVWSVTGTSFLINDPGQFLHHYYHFVAESWMGLWRFYSSLDPNINVKGETVLDYPERLIMPHCSTDGWRDKPKLNPFWLHGVFPSIAIEAKADWEARAALTGSTKVFRYDRVVMSDRSASFRGEICPSKNQRIVAEAFEVTRAKSSRWWWEPIRRSFLRVAGVDRKVMDIAVRWAEKWDGSSNGEEMMNDKQKQVVMGAHREMDVVVSYIVRAPPRRSLRPADHLLLVESLTELCKRKKWELNIVHAENITKEEQIRIAARTTVMVGVHGNGLTHLVWMPLQPISTVIEIFFPGGYAHDYEWTSRALGMRHYGMWNDTHFTYPTQPDVIYPSGFHDDAIPVYGPAVAKLVEDRVEGRLP